MEHLLFCYKKFSEIAKKLIKGLEIYFLICYNILVTFDGAFLPP